MSDDNVLSKLQAEIEAAEQALAAKKATKAKLDVLSAVEEASDAETWMRLSPEKRLEIREKSPEYAMKMWGLVGEQAKKQLTAEPEERLANLTMRVKGR